MGNRSADDLAKKLAWEVEGTVVEDKDVERGLVGFEALVDFLVEEADLEDHVGVLESFSHVDVAYGGGREEERGNGGGEEQKRIGREDGGCEEDERREGEGGNEEIEEERIPRESPSKMTFLRCLMALTQALLSWWKTEASFLL